MLTPMTVEAYVSLHLAQCVRYLREEQFGIALECLNEAIEVARHIDDDGVRTRALKLAEVLGVVGGELAPHQPVTPPAPRCPGCSRPHVSAWDLCGECAPYDFSGRGW